MILAENIMARIDRAGSNIYFKKAVHSFLIHNFNPLYILI